MPTTAPAPAGALLTAPVRAKDRRIEVLEDLVRDLLVHPQSPTVNGLARVCLWCGGQATPGPLEGIAQRIVHKMDCPIPRAVRALEVTYG